jgi:C-terminal processing protease CtpA/Prc
MKKSLLIVLLLLFQTGFAQDKLSETQKLSATAKIWGFLKYYHPNVADGSKNWDEQLFQILPQVEQAKTKEEFSVVIENWIASLGEVKGNKVIKPASKVDYFDENFDLSWIQKTNLFSEKLSSKLKFIESNRYQGTPFYVKNNSLAGNVEITNEVKYPDFKWEDKNLRLLAFFRYWNIVEYFFPYKYQMDKKWDLTLETMLPKFSNSQTELDFHLNIQELVVHLNDGHASLTSTVFYNYLGSKFIPAKYKIIDDKVVINGFLNDSLSKINDIKIGDIITKTNGKTIAEIVKEKQKYVSASNSSVLLKNFDFLMFSGNTDTLEIEFIRDGKASVKTINRYSYQNLKIKFPKAEKWKLLEGNIGYVNMSGPSVEDVPAMMKELNDTKAIIFDIRFRPRDINYEISKYLNSKVKEFAKMTAPDLSYPGRFIWKKTYNSGEDNKEHYKGKVVIIVNEEAVSHSEWTAMCLQTADKATIIGSQTAGADGNVSRFEIIKGLTTQITGLGVFYPDRRETQRIGIVPDIVVKPSITGIQEGKDEVLDRALLFIEKGK